jgi:phosphatidate cytidylyltransferase
MLRDRLIVGALLIVLVVLVLLFDSAAWHFPWLLVLVLVLGLGAAWELHQLLPAERRPPRWLALGAVLVTLLANWRAYVWPGWGGPWEHIAGALAAATLAAFLAEMATYRAPGGSVERIAFVCWVTLYLGLLPGFLAQMRFQRPGDDGAWALALAIFVPKCCDIGAYFTGRLLGRRWVARGMSPVLSPKKSFEGLAGGLVVAALTAVGLNAAADLLAWWAAVGFGVTVGLAGVLGDLAESLVKRDCGAKDASAAVPGFGGVLDVVDSVLFAAPVAYLWLRP